MFAIISSFYFANMKLFLLLAYLHLLLFLSLTTPPAIAKYAKQGCSDKCGNIRIPYPFGIGAECSVNRWYIVDCNSSKPYLPALNHLEVLGVNLKKQTVTVNTRTISPCPNPVLNNSQTKSLNLGGTPFFFSKSHNKFVFEGCGIAAIVADNGSVMTGCSTGCLNFTVSDRSNCFGNGCCQTAIPYYLNSYSINLTGLVRQGEDGGCGSAFIVDETSYDKGRFNSVGRNTSFISVSLLWTLTDSDQVTCCDKDTPSRSKVVMFDGTLVDTIKCYYGPFDKGTPYLIDGFTNKGMLSESTGFRCSVLALNVSDCRATSDKLRRCTDIGRNRIVVAVRWFHC